MFDVDLSDAKMTLNLSLTVKLKLYGVCFAHDNLKSQDPKIQKCPNEIKRDELRQ